MGGFFVDLNMNTEIKSIIHSLQDTLGGEPWYGRPVYDLLKLVNPSHAYMRPANSAHSPAELLYHMLTWAQFTLAAVQEKPENVLRDFEDLDWRYIRLSEHPWEKGVADFKETHQQLISVLQTKKDDFLEKIVPTRKYNYRFLLNGLIQHNIYHGGQLAYCAALFV